MLDADSMTLLEQRIANEFMECPGLRLTAAQAARFLGIDRPTAEVVLDRLLQRTWLVKTPTGLFIRPT